jgi:uracil phosphoribosyltransferase
MKVNILDNATLQGILTTLRDKETSTHEFRQGLRQAGRLMTYEMMNRECSLQKMAVKTAFGKADGIKIKEKLVQIMVLRAGEPLAEGGVLLLDELGIRRSVGVVDAKRVEDGSSKDFRIMMGAFKVPDFSKEEILIIYDPMLATASTLISIIQKIKEKGSCKKLIVCSVISSEYGIERLNAAHPEAIIYTLCVDKGEDKGLNRKGYIVPGLGDAGDRAFGSE